MIIPDQSHINRIREALWQSPKGCASVMVGAGFSRNARKAGPHAREFPLWQDITTELCARLYPTGDGERFKNAMSEASGTSGFLRLAQEYEVAFGRCDLHSLIKELIPDEDYAPDDMHARLLRLPWRDVFTTNWDTLLERARSLVFDHSYSVVSTFEEIPSSPKPRIIKLHGSFPAHYPLIFTEEDYRTYPRQFAPYVNTVQQAMMETILCLIGFSGDDPNFLHWSGWVRDNLGKYAPKIYLAGWLDLSPHRRRMLEDRGVVPIDIARHPQASLWPEHLHHRYATDWILHTLERGRPYEITKWPTPPAWSLSPVPDLLKPVEEVVINAPIAEPRFNRPATDPANLKEQVLSIIKVWEQNRKVYPGWLLIPINKHHLGGSDLYGWEKEILKVIPELSTLERLVVFRELVWRKENFLEPLSEQLEAAVQSFLSDIDCQTHTFNGLVDYSAQWAIIREAYRELMMALLTTARQRFNRGAFNQRLEALHPFLDDHPDIMQRIHHEKCLWALYTLNYTELEKLLKEWHPDECDPIWMSRKASILVEMDLNDEAVRLLNRSLMIVRGSPRHGKTLASPSREGWILWLALAFEKGFLRETDEVLDTPPAFERWEALAALQCDAFEQKRYLLSSLQGDSEKADAPLFDLEARPGRRITYSNAEYERWITAQRAIRLCEVAGLPPSASHTVVASDILYLAVDRIAVTNHVLASLLVLRLASSEDDAPFNRIWSRTRIAAMSMEDVEMLIGIVMDIITYALPRATSANKHRIFWVTRLRVAMEALSRLVLRLPQDRAGNILKQALAYYRMGEVAKHPWLEKPMGHLLIRAWKTLPNSCRAEYILDILSTPIAGLDEFESSAYFYPDPGELLINDDTVPQPTRMPEAEVRWSEIVQLITRGLKAGVEARKRAALRLASISFWGILTGNEKKLITQALWHPIYTGADTLPHGVTLFDWTFLFLPEPELGIAEQCFHKKWFGTQDPNNEKSYNEFFLQLGNAFRSLKKYNKPLLLSAEERKRLIAIVERWITLPVPQETDPWLIAESDRHNGIASLQFILHEIELPSSLAEKLLAKTFALNQTDAPGFRLFSCLVKFLPDKTSEISMHMRVGLASDNTDHAEDAVLGLHDWFNISSKEASQIPSPPSDLLFEIGMMIAARRRRVLHRALQVAREIFSNGSKDQCDIIAQLALNGLSYLIEELRYDRDHNEKEESDIPGLRRDCAYLALAMMASGYNTDPIITRWAEVAKDDPLPEVRHAKIPTSPRISDERSDLPL